MTTLNGPRNEIIQAIKENRLVILCGAGVSIGATRGDRRASWAGMIQYGLDWCEGQGVSLPGTDGIDRARNDLDSGDLLSAAEKLQRGLNQSGQWENFITATFSDLPLVDSRLIRAIVHLEMPISTTNYDTLIEKVAGQPPVSWRSAPVLQKALLSRSFGIAHLHGVWTDPRTVILGTANYGALLATEQTNALERALFLRSSVLFIGCGAGLDDPNFSLLRRFLKESFQGTPVPHYQLVTQDEAKAGVPLFDPDESIKKIVYGTRFDDLPDYLSELRELAYGVSKRSPRSTVRPVSPKAPEALLRMPLVRGTAIAGPTLAQLWPDLIINMQVRGLRSLSPASVDIMTWLGNSSTNRVVVIGGPGAGKSTLLRRLAIEHVSRIGGNPIFVSAEECLSLAHDSYTADSTMIIDGLDEISEDALRHVSSILEETQAKWWISCRADFFKRVSPIRPVLTSAEEVLELQPLNLTQIQQFTQRYVRKTGLLHVGDLLDTWLQDPNFEHLVSNPLHLIISVLTASQDDARASSAPRSRFELYKVFYENLLNYEADRHKLTIKDKSKVERSHIQLARSIYSRRQRNQNPPSLSSETTKGVEWQAVSSILDTYHKEDRIIIYKFTHETFSEFVLARELVSTFVASSGRFRAPSIAFNDDVNSFVREAFAGFSDLDRSQALQRLTQAYEGEPKDRSREHVLYYIGRLGLDFCPDILRTAYFEEASELGRRAAALGAILYGDLEIERDYLSRLASSPTDDSLNRAVQLVYFGDIAGDIHNGADTGEEWSRTREALIKRISSSDERSVRLRWWDLHTLASFFRTRSENPTRSEQSMLKSILETFSDEDPFRTHAIRELASDILSPSP